MNYFLLNTKTKPPGVVPVCLRQRQKAVVRPADSKYKARFKCWTNFLYKGAPETVAFLSEDAPWLRESQNLSASRAHAFVLEEWKDFIVDKLVIRVSTVFEGVSEDNRPFEIWAEPYFSGIFQLGRRIPRFSCRVRTWLMAKSAHVAVCVVFSKWVNQQSFFGPRFRRIR